MVHLTLSFKSHLPVAFARRPPNILESVSDLPVEDSITGVNISSDLFSESSLSRMAKPEAVDLHFRIRNKEQVINSIRSTEFSLVEARSILMQLRELVYGDSSDIRSDGQSRVAADKLSELNTITQRILKFFNSKAYGSIVTEQKDQELIKLLSNDRDIGVSNILSVGTVVPGIYKFSYNSEKTTFTLSSASSSQTIILKQLSEEDPSHNIESVRLHFYKLGLSLTLSVIDRFEEKAMLKAENKTSEQNLIIEVVEDFHGHYVMSDNILQQFIDKIETLSNFFNPETKNFSNHSVIEHLEKAFEQESRIRGDLGFVLNKMASNINTMEQQIENIEGSFDKIRDPTTAETVLKRSQSRMVLQSAGWLLNHAKSVESDRVLRLLDV